MTIKSSFKLAATTFLLGLPITHVWAAGCVATRGVDMHHSFFEQSPIEKISLEELKSQTKTSRFQATVAIRHFISDRHFKGKQEQKQRKREGSEVINNSHFVDFSLSYFINDLWSTNFTAPFAYHNRSQVVRDPSSTPIQRFSTQSTGFGDIRITGNRWLFDPKQAENGNIQLGIGLDLPTGNKDSEDIFMKYDSTSGKLLAEERTVDQSIQLGDGGWGLILDTYFFRKLTSQWIVYLNTSYTITPQEKNGVKTFRSNPFESEMSISDSYLIRTGVDYLVWPEKNLRANLGFRMNGVPVHDLTGGSNGFRRPGYDISIEPGIAIDMQQWSFNLSTPVTFDQNRQQSVPDKQQSEVSGIHQQGDAAFADYEILFAVSKRF